MFSRRPSLLLDQTTLRHMRNLDAVPSAHVNPQRGPVVWYGATKGTPGAPFGTDPRNHFKVRRAGAANSRRHLAPDNSRIWPFAAQSCTSRVGRRSGPFFFFRCSPTRRKLRGEPGTARAGPAGATATKESTNRIRGTERPLRGVVSCLRRQTVDTCRGLRLRRHSGPRRG